MKHWNLIQTPDEKKEFTPRQNASKLFFFHLLKLRSYLSYSNWIFELPLKGSKYFNNRNWLSANFVTIQSCLSSLIVFSPPFFSFSCIGRMNTSWTNYNWLEDIKFINMFWRFRKLNKRFSWLYYCYVTPKSCCFRSNEGMNRLRKK